MIHERLNACAIEVVSARCRLLEIYHYGQRLIGCVACIRWSWEGSKHLFMELLEEDLQALRERVTPRQAG
jgi:hypothetical protein